LHDEKNLVTRISPKSVAERAVRDAKIYCEQLYNRPAPEIELIATDPTVTTTHIEEHLHSILYGLLKKSIRTTMQHSSLAHSSLPDPSSSRRSLLSSFISSLAPSQSLKSTVGVPPISILIAQGAQDITIKISDRGGGMPMSAMNDSWSYFVYDEAEEAHVEEKEQAERPFGSGVGMSLPAARVIARYFGGDLSFVSMEGHGTDTFLSLYRDDTHLEAFPELNSSLDKKSFILP
ncbi:7118_t:CDS:2, partial [Paraglomus occultum]